MSCCPDIPEISVGGSADDDEVSQSTEMREGESVECYVRRAGNATGMLDDKTDPVPNTIENTDIPLVKGYIVNNLQFRVTKGETPETTKTPTSWSYTSEPPLPNSVKFDKAKGTLNGEFPKETYGKKFKLVVTAEPAINSRAFNFSPAKATGSNSISFIHPLPGAHVTSKFGPRKAPTKGASTQHGGVDFSVKPKPPADILAAADGKVIFRGNIRGGGNTIVIQHFNTANSSLCTTHYMHLDSFYVAEQQVVVAGQKIAKEGNTGASTGPHLHFECRLPNGDKIDPLPLIRGTVDVAKEVNINNEAVGGFDHVNGNGALTAENAETKAAQCPPYGPTYPGAKSDGPIEQTTGDAFEKAWFFTMKHEVGPHWSAALAQDPEVVAGKVDTEAQRKKCGLVTKAGFPGGVTKFGIAQKPNPDLKVLLLKYEEAKKRGFNGYWKGKPAELAGKGMPKTAVMMFDICFLHGPGNGNGMYKKIQDIKNDDEAFVALSREQRRFISSLPNADKYSGWYTRNSDLLAYVKGITA